MPQGNFEFQGRGLSFLWLLIWTTLLTLITVGIFTPWAYTAQQKWIARNTTVDGKPLEFTGTGLGLLGNWLLVFILTTITLGIYVPWGYCRLKRWEINNLHFAGGTPFAAPIAARRV